jgi:trigger factor
VQIEIENLNDLGKKINVCIPYNKINEMISTKVKKLSKQIKMDGFRPGHVPIKLIEQKFGASIRQEILSELLDSSLKQAISENNLSPIGDIKLEKIIDEEKTSAEEFLKCEFVLEVYPEVDFKDFSGLEIKTSVVNLTEQDIDNGLLNIRKKMSKNVVVDRSAINGDIVTVDFRGFVEDKEFPGNYTENLKVEIGSNLFIEGLETGLIDTCAGTYKELELMFPEDYPEKSLAGKAVKFNINVKQVEEKHLPEINEEFAKNLGIEDGDVSKIRSKVLADMESYAKQLLEEKEKKQLIDLLLLNYPIILPKSLVIQEEKRLLAACKRNYQDQGVMIKDLNEKAIQQIAAQAISNVHLSLLFRSVVANYNLNLDEKTLQNKLQQVDMLFGHSKNTNNRYKKIYNNIKDSIINSSLSELALNYVMSKVAKVKLDEPYSFTQLTTS